MGDQMQLESCVQAWDLVMGFIPSLVAKAACELGIPELLAEQADQPLSARHIALKLQHHTHNLITAEQLEMRTQLVERMMRFLSIRGVFQAHTGNPATSYSLTPLSTWLVRRGKPESLQAMLLFQASPTMQAPWHHLSEKILAGDGHVAPLNKAHGTDVWGLASADAPFSDLLNDAMSCTTHLSLQAFLAHYDGLEGVHTLVDVGGGTGTAASYIAARYSSIKVLNFDLPHVLATAPLYPGVEHIAGDMFEAIPCVDAIFMKWVLHDWSDEDCIKILQNCKKVLPTHGKIIIMDAVLEDVCTQTSPFHNLRVTLDMVMMAHTTSGKERTKEQWKCILHGAKFFEFRFIDLPCPQCVIEVLGT